MFNQHAKWLQGLARRSPWRKPIASLNYLLSSHVWRQDHNGFSHQDPGFIDHVANKHSDTVRIYLATRRQHAARRNRPRAALAQLRQPDHLRASSPHPQYLGMDRSRAPATSSPASAPGHWASNTTGDEEPDVVIACAGDVPTMEALAAVTVLRDWAPECQGPLRQRGRPLHPRDPHTSTRTASTDEDFDRLFTLDKPVIFAFHGYPTIIHKLTYKRKQPRQPPRSRLPRSTAPPPRPFDMTVLNKLDRYTLALDVIEPHPAPSPISVHAAEPEATASMIQNGTSSTSPNTAKTSPKSATGSGLQPAAASPRSIKLTSLERLARTQEPSVIPCCRSPKGTRCMSASAWQDQRKASPWRLLTINSGSSSLKFGLYTEDGTSHPHHQGKVDGASATPPHRPSTLNDRLKAKRASQLKREPR